MNKQEITPILGRLNAVSADISASVVLSADGLAIALASASAQDPDEDSLSALSAAMVHLAHKVMRDLDGSDLEQVLVQSQVGYLMAVPVCQDLILTVVANPDAELGTILPEMKRAANRISHLCAPVLEVA